MMANQGSSAAPVVGSSGLASRMMGSLETGDGLPILIAGIAWQFIQLLGFPFQIEFGIGIIFWLGASSIIFQRRGMVPSILFIIGYFSAVYLQSTFPFVVVLVLLLSWGLATHLGDFREWLVQELGIGLLLFFVFTLDIGLVYVLVGLREGTSPLLGFLPFTFSFPLTETAIGLFKLIPWWGAVGLFTTKPREGVLSSIFVGGLQLIFVGYLVFTIIYAMVPDVGRKVTTLPGLPELGKEVEEARARLPKGENPFISQMACTFAFLTDPQQIEECVKGRQAESKCEHLKKTDVSDADNQEYQECLREAKGERQASVAAGGVDPTIKEFTKLEIKKAEGFPDELTSNVQPVPLEFVIETPRSNLEVHVGCSFSSGETSIPGVPTPEKFTARRGQERKSVICSPSEELPEGSVTMAIEAELTNMQTTSRLQRAFVGEKTSEEKDEIRREFFPSGQAVSLSPPEFVRINFAIGDPPADPLIDSTDQPILISTIENLGGGEITEIKKAEIQLVEGLRAQPDPQRCNLQVRDQVLVGESRVEGELARRQKIPFGICALEMDEALQLPEQYFVVKDFSAVIEYSYKIKKQFTLRVQDIFSEAAR